MIRKNIVKAKMKEADMEKTVFFKDIFQISKTKFECLYTL